MPSNTPEESSPPGGVLDRDQAREVIHDAHPADWEPPDRWMEDLLDALAACVRPVAIDRDALVRAEAACEQYGEQLEAVGEELDRWKREVRLLGKNREHAERLEDILEGERS